MSINPVHNKHVSLNCVVMVSVKAKEKGGKSELFYVMHECGIKERAHPKILAWPNQFHDKYTL